MCQGVSVSSHSSVNFTKKNISSCVGTRRSACVRGSQCLLTVRSTLPRKISLRAWVPEEAHVSGGLSVFSQFGQLYQEKYLFVRGYPKKRMCQGVSVSSHSSVNFTKKNISSCVGTRRSACV